MAPEKKKRSAAAAAIFFTSDTDGPAAMPFVDPGAVSAPLVSIEKMKAKKTRAGMAR